MAMHVVLGDGEMTRRELTATLADLWKADEAEKQSFWFLVHGKSEPTETDQTLVTWLEKNEIYYEVVTDDEASMSDLYAQPQEVHTAKKLAQKVVALMQSKPEEGETAEILALFTSSDPAAAEDAWLNGVVLAAYDAGFRTRALNDGLVEIDLSDEAAAAEQEPADNVTPLKSATKAIATKAVKKAAPRVDTPVPDEEEVEAEPAPAGRKGIPTRAELEDMEPSEIREVAASLGITLPSRTRTTTYIDHILGEGKASAPAAEIEDVPAVVVADGEVNYEAVANLVADLLWERIQKAIANV